MPVIRLNLTVSGHESRKIGRIRIGGYTRYETISSPRGIFLCWIFGYEHTPYGFPTNSLGCRILDEPFRKFEVTRFHT